MRPRAALAMVLLAVGCTNEVASVRELEPGSEVVLEGTLERGDRTWGAAPFLQEVPYACPLASSTALPSPHHAFVLRATALVALDVTLERPDGASASADMALGVYAGEALPRTAEGAGDCLAIASASGPFPGEALGVPIDEGESVVVALWSYAGALPQRYRLTLRAE